MSNEIKIEKFVGMNNIKDSEGNLNQPTTLLNVDVNDEGQLIKRDGYVKYVSLSGAHSLFARDSAMLCAAGCVIYKIEHAVAIPLFSYVGSPDEPVYYAEAEGEIFIGNKFFKKVYDPRKGSISDWGIDIPNQPTASVSRNSGGLAEGVYHLCLTTEGDDGRLSGNGPIEQVIVGADDSSIIVSGRGDDDVLWCTDANGDVFFRVGKTNRVDSVSSVEPLPTFMCSPPYFLDNITFAFGRMWGAKGKKLFYSEPFNPHLFRNDLNYFEFPYEINLIASSVTGLFIGTEIETFSLLGSTPEQMRQSSVGSGSVPGSLTYCDNAKELGDVLSPAEKVHNSVPIWVTQGGVVMGNASGRLFNLTQRKVNIDPSNNCGASLYRQKKNLFQFIAGFPQGNLNDTATRALRSGRLFEPPSVGDQHADLGFSDEFEATVYRNGEVV